MQLCIRRINRFRLFVIGMHDNESRAMRSSHVARQFEGCYACIQFYDGDRSDILKVVRGPWCSVDSLRPSVTVYKLMALFSVVKSKPEAKIGARRCCIT